MNPKTKIYLVFLLMYFVQIGFAQQKTVTGTVTDFSGLPLPGVSVVAVAQSSLTGLGYFRRQIPNVDVVNPLAALNTRI